MPRPAAARRIHPEPGGRRLDGPAGPDVAAGQLQRIVRRPATRAPREGHWLLEATASPWHLHRWISLDRGPGMKVLSARGVRGHAGAVEAERGAAGSRS